MRGSMKKQVVRYLFLALTLAIMATIYFFSSQNGNESDALSGTLAARIEAWLATFLPAETAGYLVGFLRKGAHVLLYLLLGISLSVFFFTLPVRRGVWLWIFPLLICALYASLDEVHQTFVAGRAGNALDVCIDAIGFLLAVVCANAIRIFKHRKKKRL